MTPEEIIAKVKARARNNFKTGMNCAECVFEAILPHLDVNLPPETMCVMTGFGGGVGLFGDTCGALKNHFPLFHISYKEAGLTSWQWLEPMAIAGGFQGLVTGWSSAPLGAQSS